MAHRLRRAAILNIALAFGAFFCAPPAGLVLLLIGIDLCRSADRWSYSWGVILACGGLTALSLPITYFFFVYDRLQKARCAACGAAQHLEIAERGRFCYICGTRYQPGRRPISFRQEEAPANDELCGCCAAKLKSGDIFCFACGANVTSRSRSHSLLPRAANICPFCGEKILNRRLAIFTLRAPQAIYCSHCGSLLKPLPTGEQYGQEQI